MIKVLGWTDRPGPLDPTDPLAAFVADGGPVAAEAAGVVGLMGTVVSSVLERTRGDLTATAFLEQWWVDAAAFAAWRAAHQPVTGSGAGSGSWFVTVEHVLRQPAIGSGELKIMGSAHRLASLTTDAFFAYWRDVHGPLSARAPGLRGYVVSEVTQRLSGPVEADGFVEQWWPDAATLEHANASEEVAIAWADVANYARTTGTFWLAREHVLRAPSLPRGSL